jgi:hypothetical protein
MPLLSEAKRSGVARYPTLRDGTARGWGTQEQQRQTQIAFGKVNKKGKNNYEGEIQGFFASLRMTRFVVDGPLARTG